MRSLWSALALALLVVAVGCNNSTELAASFTADAANPSNAVSMAQASQSGDVVEVAVRVTGVNDVYGADFEVRYDAARLQFVSHGAGTLLETGGNTPTYQVTEIQPGVQLIGATRVGPVAGVDVSGTVSLIRLRFRALEAGNSRLDFDSTPALLNDTPPPGNNNISGLTWTGGTVIAE